MDKKESPLSTGDELKPDAPADEKPCCGCGLSGPGGKLRVGLLVVLAIVVVVLLVRGFSG
jgi:hypothetical protein